MSEAVVETEPKQTTAREPTPPVPLALTLEQKVALYRSGRYRFGVPPVTTRAWAEADWLRYIDAQNGWLPVTAREAIAELRAALRAVLEWADPHALPNSEANVTDVERARAAADLPVRGIDHA